MNGECIKARNMLDALTVEFSSERHLIAKNTAKIAEKFLRMSKTNYIIIIILAQYERKLSSFSQNAL